MVASCVFYFLGQRSNNWKFAKINTTFDPISSILPYPAWHEVFLETFCSKNNCELVKQYIIVVFLLIKYQEYTPLVLSYVTQPLGYIKKIKKITGSKKGKL